MKLRGYMYVVAFLVILPLCSCLAQEIRAMAKFDYDGNEFTPGIDKFIRQDGHGTLNIYVANYIARELKLYSDTVCETGIALVKFKLTGKDGVTDVACTKYTPPALAKVYKEAVQKSSKYWRVTRDIDMYYVLPVHYNYKTRCGELIENKKGQHWNEIIFYFDDGTSLEETTCVILRSVWNTTGVNETFWPPLPKKER